MLKKISGTTLYEQVMDQIKDMIAQGIYQKGDLLPSEKELMQMTGVSRITVREALKALAEVGMIETRHGKGSFVLVDPDTLRPDTGTAEQRMAYRERFLASSQARLLVEPELARLAAENATAEEIAHMEAILQRKHNSAAGESSFDDFHYAVGKAARNPFLLEFVQRLVAQELEGRSTFLLPLPEDQKRASSILKDQHRKVLDAIREGDSEFAYFYMKEHTRYVLRAYEEYFERFC